MSSSSLFSIRSAAMEILAAATIKLFPNILLASGEVSDVGFHYDFLTDQPINVQALPLIEDGMWMIIKSKVVMKSIHMMRENAVEFFRYHGQPLKAAIIASHPDNILDMIQFDNFTDLCPIPHPNSSDIEMAFKLERISPVTVRYHEDEKLQGIRIEGTAFPDKQQLKQFLKRAENAQKYQHKELLTHLNLAFHKNFLDGESWFWQPKGMFLRHAITNLYKKEYEVRNFCEITTPNLLPKTWLKQTNIPDDRSPSVKIDNICYNLTPSLKVRHALFFKNTSSNREKFSPVRYVEWTTKYKDVKVGDLKGLLRTQTYTVDCSHIFCTPNLVHQELISSLQFIDKIVKVFNVEAHWHLCVQKAKFSRKPKGWEQGIAWLINALESLSIHYSVDEQKMMWSGPRIELRYTDPLGRMWRGPYVGIDCYHPEALQLHSNDKHTVSAIVMLTCSMMGSLERLIALFVEHCTGVLPLWIVPEQVRLVPLAVRNRPYAEQIQKALEATHCRVTCDMSDAPLSKRIHAAEIEKIPYIVIIGDKEQKDKTVAIRNADQSRKSHTASVETFLAQIKVLMGSCKTS